MSTYEISKSSLLSLKAEILRKQEELNKTKVENDVKIKNLKKNSPLEIKNKGLENRQKNDIDEESHDLLKKSKAALEAKSRLYDKLSKNSKRTEEEIEYNRRYLVRFDKKQKSNVPDLPPEDEEDDYDRHHESDEETNANSYDPPTHPDDDWVEYVDCLGRTRTCLRRDLDHVRSRDKVLKQIVDEKRKNRGDSPLQQSETLPDPPSIDDTPEITEENELLSNDMRRELLRKQWENEEEELKNKTNIHYQDILFNEARTHGVGYYGFSKDEEERAREQEALKKLREETEQQQKKAQELKALREKQLAARVKAAKNRRRARLGLPLEEDEPEPIPVPEPPVKESKVDDEKEKLLEEKRKQHVRPWDIGKEGVKEHYEYSQEEWVDKKRRERPTEFAPPSSYNKSNEKKERDAYKSKKFGMFSRSDKKESINPYRNSQSMEPIPIFNECTETYDNPRDEINFSTTKKTEKRGVEIPPPPTMEYYGGNTKHKKQKTEKPANVGDSIEAGLKFLRQQMEKKNNSKGRNDDIFLD